MNNKTLFVLGFIIGESFNGFYNDFSDFIISEDIFFEKIKEILQLNDRNFCFFISSLIDGFNKTKEFNNIIVSDIVRYNKENYYVESIYGNILEIIKLKDLYNLDIDFIRVKKRDVRQFNAIYNISAEISRNYYKDILIQYLDLITFDDELIDLQEFVKNKIAEKSGHE